MKCASFFSHDFFYVLSTVSFKVSTSILLQFFRICGIKDLHLASMALRYLGIHGIACFFECHDPHGAHTLHPFSGFCTQW
jgi:hypothetical protein